MRSAVNGDGFSVRTWHPVRFHHKLTTSSIIDLNLPLTGLAAILVVATLKLKTPGGSFREKLLRMDWGYALPLYRRNACSNSNPCSGNFLIISSTCAIVIGLTWGGAQFPWGSAKVIVPLVLGFVGLFGFFIYEAVYASEPLVSGETTLPGR